jgi:hypothetical protein
MSEEKKAPNPTVEDAYWQFMLSNLAESSLASFLDARDRLLDFQKAKIVYFTIEFTKPDEND